MLFSALPFFHRADKLGHFPQLSLTRPDSPAMFRKIAPNAAIDVPRARIDAAFPPPAGGGRNIESGAPKKCRL
jgi:hypothetical protein